PFWVVRDGLDVGLDEGGEPVDRVAAGRVAERLVRAPLEGGRRRGDDPPEDVLLRRNVGVEAGALDVERAGDVADARGRVAVRVEQLAGNLLALAPPGTCFPLTVPTAQ